MRAGRGAGLDQRQAVPRVRADGGDDDAGAARPAPPSTAGSAASASISGQSAAADGSAARDLLQPRPRPPGQGDAGARGGVLGEVGGEQLPDEAGRPEDDEVGVACAGGHGRMLTGPGASRARRASRGGVGTGCHDGPVLLADVVAASAAVAATRVPHGEGHAPSPSCSGGPTPPRWSRSPRGSPGETRPGPARRRLAHPVAARRRARGRAPSLTVAAVDTALDRAGDDVGRRVGGPARRGRSPACSSAATAEEQRFLVRLLTGELRQGALEGVVLDAVAAAADVPAATVRRAFMLSGRLPGDRGPRADRRGGGARGGAAGGRPARCGRCWPARAPRWTPRWTTSART